MERFLITVIAHLFSKAVWRIIERYFDNDEK